MSGANFTLWLTVCSNIVHLHICVLIQQFYHFQQSGTDNWIFSVFFVSFFSFACMLEQTQNTSGSSTMKYLSGFRPYSSYEISVCSFTRVGHGNQFSLPVTFTTNESGKAHAVCTNMIFSHKESDFCSRLRFLRSVFRCIIDVRI